MRRRPNERLQGIVAGYLRRLRINDQRERRRISAAR
jgi:hypothetical protein